ncbi:hypothetical protein [Microcystis aeruginosa]|nr:hypothetical protein [Microcystis aeruginosa]MDB9413765.1 hypothetical protein [Microcystis aeruginosa CS-567/02]
MTISSIKPSKELIMSFDRTPNFTEKLATDPDFRLKVLDEIANDDELKFLTEEDIKAIFGGNRSKHQDKQPYGSVRPL